MLPIPEGFRQRIIDVHGETGAAWLDTVPEIARRCEKRFGVRIHTVLPNLTYNLIVAARSQAGHNLIVKFGVPGPALRYEMSALGLYAGKGAVQLLDGDATLGALLLQYVVPGTSLRKSAPADAVGAFTVVYEALRRPAPVPSSLPHLDRLGSCF